jgi:signal transduction histidine kinase
MMSGMKKAPLKKNSSAGAPAEVMTVDNIGRLAGGIAHDLNTILTTIYGYSELALESVDKSSEAGLSIMKITEAADKARELTEQLLNLQLSKRQEKPVVRLNDIITETVNFVRLSLRGNIEVTTRMTSWDLYVEADPIQLFRVFLNLTVNATQAMEKDGGRLTISLGVISGRPGKESSEHSTARVRFELHQGFLNHTLPPARREKEQAWGCQWRVTSFQG